MNVELEAEVKEMLDKHSYYQKESNCWQMHTLPRSYAWL